MVDNHLKSLEKELSCMPPKRILGFGLSCISRQVVALKLNFPGFSETDFSNLLDAINQARQNFASSGKVDKFERSKYDEAILEFTNGADYTERYFLAYEILGNIVDFLEAYSLADIDYIKEYSAYRNFNLLESLEAFLFGDVEGFFENKNPLIRTFIIKEIEAQNADIKILSDESDATVLSKYIGVELASPIFILD